VTLTQVDATYNGGTGIRVDTAESFLDTVGTYSHNDDGGIVVNSIAGDGTLGRTTADDNDAAHDGTGDRLTARPDPSGLVVIGGNFEVQGGRFRDNVFGLFPAHVNGSATLENYGPAAMEVTGNQASGVQMRVFDTATFTGGAYSNNGTGISITIA